MSAASRAGADARVVELCGLPGAGKSTAAALLLDALLAEGRPCRIADAGISAGARREARAVRRVAGAAAAAAAAPGAQLGAWTAVARSGQRRATDALRIGVQWSALQHLVARAHARGGLHLLEEGFAQTLWSASLRARSLPPDALWSRLPAPRRRTDLVVVLDVAPDVARDRLARRPSRHSRTQHLAEREALAELVAGRVLLEEVLSGCPAPVVRVPADGDPVTVAAAVHDLLTAPR